MTATEPLVEVPHEAVEELRRRLTQTRWPIPWPVADWKAGTSNAELRRMVEYWRTGYDWRAHEAELNALPSHVVDVGERPLHYLRFEGEQPQSVPIVLTNGWPSTFFELTELAQRLAAPSRFGSDAEVCFTVIVPSLPGYTFSAPRPSLPSDLPTHELWHRLMRDHLGFASYAAHGGDLGAGITSRLAAAYPDELIGIHLMAVGAPQQLDAATLTEQEQEYLRRIEEWDREEGAYMHQQSTRPLTLSYGLSDSPVGLLAWILEKYRAWSDYGGDVSSRFTDDFLLTQASLYWFTNTISTSFRPYYEYGRGVPRSLARVSVPTAVALFPADLSQPPRSWAERTYNVVRYRRMPRGGHFAPVEEPALLAEDIAEFVASLK
jgi:pimeloyl-ACP methyl ester carboxylesterase